MAECDSFDIVGDEIRYDGDTVAIFLPGVIPSVRDAAEQKLLGLVDEDELADTKDELERLEAAASAQAEELEEWKHEAAIYRRALLWTVDELDAATPPAAIFDELAKVIQNQCSNAASYRPEKRAASSKLLRGESRA